LEETITARGMFIVNRCDLDPSAVATSNRVTDRPNETPFVVIGLVMARDKRMAI
jgi:hypothetical protein